MRFNIDLSPKLNELSIMFRQLDGDLLGDVVEGGLVRGARQAAREVQKTTKFKDRRPGVGLRSKIRGVRGKERFKPSAIIHVGGKGARQASILQTGGGNSKAQEGFVDERIAIGRGNINREFDIGLNRRFRNVLRELSGEARLKARTVRALGRSNFVFGRFFN